MIRRIIPVLLASVLLVLAFPLLASAKADPAVVHANIARVAEEAFNQGKLDVIDEVFADSFVSHPDEASREAFKQSIVAFRSAFPDLHATADLISVEGDWAAFRFTQSGTFENPLVSPQGEVPPTGKPVTLTITVFAHFDADGKEDEEWDFFDNLGFLMQIGVIPAPEGSEASSGEAMLPMMPMMTEAAPMMSGMEAANKAAAARVFDEVINQGKLDLFDQLATDDFVHHELGVAYDRPGWKMLIGALRIAIPDLALTPETTVAEGNLVAVRYTATGTFTNGLPQPDGSTLPPNNQAISVPAGLIIRFDDQGKIAEVWDEYDGLSFLTQLGAIPPMDGSS